MGNTGSLEVKERYSDRSDKGLLPKDAMKRCDEITTAALKKAEITKDRKRQLMEATRSVVNGSKETADVITEMPQDLLRLYVKGSELYIDMLVYHISKKKGKVNSVYAFQCSYLKDIYKFHNKREEMKAKIQKCVYDFITKVEWPGKGGDRALLTAIATKDDPDQINTML